MTKNDVFIAMIAGALVVCFEIAIIIWLLVKMRKEEKKRRQDQNNADVF